MRQEEIFAGAVNHAILNHARLAPQVHRQSSCAAPVTRNILPQHGIDRCLIAFGVAGPEPIQHIGVEPHRHRPLYRPVKAATHRIRPIHDLWSVRICESGLPLNASSAACSSLLSFLTILSKAPRPIQRCLLYARICTYSAALRRRRRLCKMDPPQISLRNSSLLSPACCMIAASVPFGRSRL